MSQNPTSGWARFCCPQSKKKSHLLEHRVYLVSDWAILNDTNSKQLQRIFSQFHHLTSREIEQATQLLESYHAVYRAQRLLQRQAGTKGQCHPPTTEQPEGVTSKLKACSNKLSTPLSYTKISAY
jgi:hypothetical protein